VQVKPGAQGFDGYQPTATDLEALQGSRPQRLIQHRPTDASQPRSLPNRHGQRLEFVARGNLIVWATEASFDRPEARTSELALLIVRLNFEPTLL
jgi:hypothetical protein